MRRLFNKIIKYGKIILPIILVSAGFYFFVIKAPDRANNLIQKTSDQNRQKSESENKIEEEKNDAIDQMPALDSKLSEGELALSDSELNSYYALYKEPGTISLRTALNNYLSGNGDGLESTAVVKATLPNTGELMGLNAFDRNYYKSKFIILLRNPQGSAGGDLFTIIFVDRPDKVFQAWMAGDNSTGYSLRGFMQLNKYDEAAIVDIKTKYKRFFTDFEHMM